MTDNQAFKVLRAYASNGDHIHLIIKLDADGDVVYSATREIPDPKGGWKTIPPEGFWQQVPKIEMLLETLEVPE